MAETIDVLAIAAHPDDAELLCGGTLRRAADQGHRTGILDLTGGETGTQGSAALRATEARRAGEILGLAVRRNAGLPDSSLQNDPASRLVVAQHIRDLRPRVVIAHGSGGRHPDHRAANQLAHDACFIAGLSRAALDGAAFRPEKILYCLAFDETPAKPTFVIDITAQMERKLDAVFAFDSQFAGKTWAGDIFGGDPRPLREQLEAHAAHYGSLIRKPFGEPFWTRETMIVDDVMQVGVRSL